MDDWVPLDSLLDSHNHANPLEKKIQRKEGNVEKVFRPEQAKLALFNLILILSYIAAAKTGAEPNEGTVQEAKENSSSYTCKHYAT